MPDITRHIPAVTLAAQGLSVVAPGIYGLIRPADFMAQMDDGLTVESDQIVHAMSLQLLTMGVYFLLASREPRIHRTALVANVSLRLLAGYLFWRDGLRSVAAWEMLWGGLNAAAALFA